jgi:hypothetical protein
MSLKSLSFPFKIRALQQKLVIENLSICFQLFFSLKPRKIGIELKINKDRDSDFLHNFGTNLNVIFNFKFLFIKNKIYSKLSS